MGVYEGLCTLEWKFYLGLLKVRVRARGEVGGFCGDRGLIGDARVTHVILSTAYVSATHSPGKPDCP